MNDKLMVLFLCAFFFIVHFQPNNISAGECDCKPTYDAKAKVSDNCSTIWNKDSCTLKEVKKTSQTSTEIANWTNTLSRKLETDPAYILDPKWASMDINSYEKVLNAYLAPKLNNMQYFESLVAFTLAGEVPESFAAQVIDGIRKHKDEVIEGWQKTGEGSTSFNYNNMTFILKRHIIYATKGEIAFYINLRREGPPPSFPRR